MKSGKLISAGYSSPLYEVPIYKKFKSKNGCPNAKKFTEHNFHRRLDDFVPQVVSRTNNRWTLN